MRAGYFILLYLIRHAMITNVYAQDDVILPTEKSYKTADTILMVSIIVGSVMIALVLSFMCCPNFLCCCCPDIVRYCCIGYPKKKAGYIRQTQNRRQDGYIRRNPNGKIQRVNQNSFERQRLLEDRPGVRQGNQNNRVEYVPVEYQPIPATEKVQMPPTVASHMPWHQSEPRTLFNPYAPVQVTLTPGPCPQPRYSLPMMPVGQNEVFRPPTGQPVFGMNGKPLHEFPNQVLHDPNQVQH